MNIRKVLEDTYQEYEHLVDNGPIQVTSDFFGVHIVIKSFTGFRPFEEVLQEHLEVQRR
jgi:hypothetical protein